VNIGKLFWRCQTCLDPKSKKPGMLLGLDSELEHETGKRRIEELQEEASSKRIKPEEHNIVASGVGLNWSALINDVRDGARDHGAILERLDSLLMLYRAINQRLEALERRGARASASEGVVPDPAQGV
jgi:hypothetical protein